MCPVLECSDLLHYIFGFMPSEDKLLHLPLVCKTFASACRNSASWPAFTDGAQFSLKHVLQHIIPRLGPHTQVFQYSTDLQFPSLGDDLFARLTERCPNLEAVPMPVTMAQMKCLSTLKRLKYLHVAFLSLRTEQFHTALRDCLVSCGTSLQEYSMYDSCATPYVVAMCPNLTSYTGPLDDETLAEFARGENCPLLSTLHGHRPAWAREDVHHMQADVLRVRGSTLTELTVWDHDGGALTAMADYLQPGRLQKCELHMRSATPVAEPHSELFSRLGRVIGENLVKCVIKATGQCMTTEQFAELIGQCPSLRIFNVHNLTESSFFDVSCVDAILESACAATLEYVTIYCNHAINDDASIALATRLPRLQSLHIYAEASFRVTCAKLNALRAVLGYPSLLSYRCVDVRPMEWA